jgi:hypothetical protein
MDEEANNWARRGLMRCGTCERVKLKEFVKDAQHTNRESQINISHGRSVRVSFSCSFVPSIISLSADRYEKKIPMMRMHDVPPTC